MGTTTLLVLDTALLKIIGDSITHPVTTAIAASTSVVSTHLQQYRSTADYFNDWWIYFDDEANAGKSRKISDDDGTSTLTVLGGNLTTDVAEITTFRLSRYTDFPHRLIALNDAIDEIYPDLHIRLEDRQLITGNILPPFRWPTTTTLDLYSATNLTSFTKSATAGIYRGTVPSAKLVASAANGYLSIHSDNYPRLLDMMNKGVSVYAWALPEVADDATLVIYTKTADGTTQTITSTTDNPAGEFSLLKLENRSMSDDLVEAEIRMKVATNAKYVYFMQPRFVGRDIYEYLLPNDFDNGNISQVDVQSEAYSDYSCDDIQPRAWERVFGYSFITRNIAGTDYKYIRLPWLYTDSRQIKLIGDKPLETLSTATTTISLDGHRLKMLLEYAAFRMFDNLSSGVSSDDRDHYERESIKHLAKYERLKRKHMMMRPAAHMNLPVYQGSRSEG